MMNLNKRTILSFLVVTLALLFFHDRIQSLSKLFSDGNKSEQAVFRIVQEDIERLRPPADVSREAKTDVHEAYRKTLDKISLSQKVKNIDLCLEKGTCSEFQVGKARNYYYAATLQKKKLLRDGKYEALSKMGDSTYKDFALSLVDSKEDHIVEVGLEYLLEVNSLSEEDWSFVFSAVELSNSRDLHEQAFDLARMKGVVKNPEYVYPALRHIISGGIDSSSYLARIAYHMMNKENIFLFIKTLNEMSQNSKRYNDLNANIKSFVRLHLVR